MHTFIPNATHAEWPGSQMLYMWSSRTPGNAFYR